MDSKYTQYQLGLIADEVEGVIKINGTGHEADRGYNSNTINVMKRAIRWFKVSEVYISRIDSLLSGKDTEARFILKTADDLTRLQVELNELYIMETKNNS